MNESEIEILRDKVKRLESELKEREHTLGRYKNELVKANGVLEKLIRRVGKELDLVAQMQKWLVPTRFPNIPSFEFSSKYLPGTQVGGDYIDIFETDDKFQFGIVVSSSNGYSASAHFLSAFFKFSIEKGFHAMPPEQALKIILEDMAQNISEGQEVHLFYGLIDRRRFELHFSMLGGVQALIWRHQKEELEKIGQEQQVFSPSFSGSILRQTISLCEKDILIFCSPGILNVCNMEGKSFGSQRLYQAILQSKNKSPHSLRNEIYYQIEKFVGAENFPADMTVVIAEVGGQALKLA